MKKIVAVVLALVMVLGLATTAFGATLTGDYTFKFTTKAGMEGAAADTGAITVTDAKAPKDVNKDGVIDTATFAEAGYVKTFGFANVSGVFAQVATAADADMVVYVEDTDTVFGYFAYVAGNNPYYYGTGVAFNDFGEKCGQYDDEPTPEAKYYTFQKALYVATTAGAGEINLMVDGKLVAVNKMADAGWVGHTPAYTYDKDYKVVGVKCAECGVVADIYKTFAAVPAKAVAYPLADGAYYVWTNAVEAPAATDKVESAQTFDAGIAMYVGMSVMAAAGSAVVLKKKD